MGPPSAGAGRQDTAGGDRQAQLLGVDLAAVTADDALFQHIRQNAGLEAGRVGVDQVEQRLVGEHLGTGIDQAEELVLQLPYLAGRAAAVAGRIHQDAVVLIAPADFPLDKAQGVLHDEAEAILRQTGQLAVLLRPLHDALARVHMGHMRAGLRAGDGRRAGVAEQVQHLHVRAARIADQLLHPHPVRRLLREQARVLEARRADVELHVLVADRPPFRQTLEKLPLAAALFGAVVMGLRLAPQLRIGLGPDGLRIRPAQNDIAPALQLFAVGAVQYFKIIPI